MGRRPQIASAVQSEETFVRKGASEEEFGYQSWKEQNRRMVFSFVMEEAQERRHLPATSAWVQSGNSGFCCLFWLSNSPKPETWARFGTGQIPAAGYCLQQCLGSSSDPSVGKMLCCLQPKHWWSGN